MRLASIASRHSLCLIAQDRAGSLVLPRVDDARVAPLGVRPGPCSHSFSVTGGLYVGGMFDGELSVSVDGLEQSLVEAERLITKLRRYQSGLLRRWCLGIGA